MRACLYVFLAWPLLCLCAPARRPIDDDGEKSEENPKRTKPGEGCYFANHPKTELETEPRPRTSVLGDCSGEIKRLKDYVQNEKAPVFGSVNQRDLLFVRGSGNFTINWDDEEEVERIMNLFICSGHYKELITNWNDPEYKHVVRVDEIIRCSMPPQFEHKPNPKNVRGKAPLPQNRLDKEEVRAIAEHYHILLHAGLPVCTRHKNEASELAAQRAFERKNIQPSVPLVNGLLSQTPPASQQANNNNDRVLSQEFMSQCSVAGSTNSQHDDPDYEGANEMETDSREKHQTFKDFAAACGVSRVSQKSGNHPYTQLKPDTQRKKRCAARTLMDDMFHCMAGEEWEILKEQTIKEVARAYGVQRSEDFENLMENIAELYRTAESKSERIHLLSLVTPFVHHAELVSYIPNVSWNLFSKSRRHAKLERARALPKETNGRLERYDPVKINRFIEFIVSVSIVSPTRRRSLSTRYEKLNVPDMIRSQSNAEIIRMFKDLMEEHGESHLIMTDRMMFRILKALEATRRRSMACVDYYLADMIESTLDELQEKRLIGDHEKKMLSVRLDEDKLYLRTDFKLHVKQSSPVADHCFVHALSDPKETNLRTLCTHDQTCETLKDDLSSLKNRLTDLKAKTLEANKRHATRDVRDQLEFLDKKISDFNKASVAIDEFKKHQLRSAVSEGNLGDFMDQLDHGHALLTMDFAQKYLPSKHRETQEEYYGKRGISWHITHMVANISGFLGQHTFLHVFDNSNEQTSTTVTGILRHILYILGRMDMQEVVIRSDNAGYYHCASTIATLPALQDEFGVRIRSYSFSETQNGKAAADRMAAVVKRKLRDFVDGGGNIEEPSDIISALKSDHLLRGVSFYLYNMESDITSKTKWPGITNFYHFEIGSKEVDGEEVTVINAWKSRGVGHGIQLSNPEPNDAKLEIVDLGGYYRPDSDIMDNDIESLTTDYFWLSVFSRKKKISREKAHAHHEGDDEDDAEDGPGKVPGLFDCPEESCIASFTSEAWLENHILRGRHKHAPQKYDTVDYAKKAYHEKVEMNLQERTNLLAVAAIISGNKESEKAKNPLPSGWALKTRKAPKRYTADMKSFLDALYDEGVRNPSKRVNGAKAVKALQNARNPDGALRFKPDDIPNSRRIDAYFSRRTGAIKKKNKRIPQGEPEKPLETADEEKLQREIESNEGDEELEGVQTEPDDFNTLRNAISSRNADIFEQQ